MVTYAHEPRALPPTARMTVLIPAVLASLVLVATLDAEQIGRIEYLQGNVELLRGEEVLDAFSLGPGEPLFEMDVIQTGFDGYAEIVLTVNGRTMIRVKENTAYYLEIQPRTGGGAEARLRVLTGSIEMAVEQLSRNSTITVSTRTSTMGVRGTEFDVLTAPDESTLTGVRSGVVTVTAAGREVRADGGMAVEAQPEQAPRSTRVPDGDFERYYQTWTETRLQAFRSGATTFIRAYARRYRDMEPDFESAYENLMRHRDRLREATRGDSPALGTDMRLRTEVSPAIIRMRSILPLFENTVYRLRELQRFHEQGVGTTQIDNESSAEFFARFAAEERRLTRRLAEVRAVFRMYRTIEQRSFGGLPGGLESPFGGDSPINSMQF